MYKLFYQHKKIYQIIFYLMILLYALAGLNHFINPKFYLNIMPAYIPYPAACVYASGVLEFVFAILLLFKATKNMAAWLIIAMLIVFFTVHVDMVITNRLKSGLEFWMPLIRFFIQFILIRWAYSYTNQSSRKKEM